MPTAKTDNRAKTVTRLFHEQVDAVIVNGYSREASNMSLSDELQTLTVLHQQGHLSDQEFSEAKRRLLSGRDVEHESAPEDDREDSECAVIDEKLFQSSRWSSGNLFFPDSLMLSSDGLLYHKGALIGSHEEHINYRAVASVSVKNGIFLSDVVIETSGGSIPIINQKR